MSLDLAQSDSVVWLLRGGSRKRAKPAVGAMTAYLNSHGNDEWHS